MRLHYLICLLILAIGARAQSPSQPATFTRTTVFPPVGLAFSETARVNVANNAANPKSGNAASCSGTISFNNASGAAVGSPNKFTVTSGQISSANLTAAELGVDNGSRSEFIASVQLTLAPQTPCNLTISLETFDSTSAVTHLYLAGGSVGAPSTVEPVLGGGN